jgi:hypothetical protein
MIHNNMLYSMLDAIFILSGLTISLIISSTFLLVSNVQAVIDTNNKSHIILNASLLTNRTHEIVTTKTNNMSDRSCK